MKIEYLKFIVRAYKKKMYRVVYTDQAVYTKLMLESVWCQGQLCIYDNIRAFVSNNVK